MTGQLEVIVPGRSNLIPARIGNASDCRKGISEAVSKRAYEIYQRQGCRPGHDQENWWLAENQILQPLCCGVLESKDRVNISMLCSALGTKDIEEIEVCVEPHRLIVVGKKRSDDSDSRKCDKIYRVLLLTEEFDPSSVKMTQHGALLEIEIAKSRLNRLNQNSIAPKKAA